MEQVVSDIIIFVIIFLLVFVIYNFAVINKEKKRLEKMKKKNQRVDEAAYPAEVMYLVKRYQLDLKKVNYFSLLREISLVCSFDLSLIAYLATQVNGTIWQILIAAILCIPVIYISFMLYGKRLQKKGLTKVCTTQKK
ncbi:MAG: hypothetical protein SOZ06_06150 [Candidatus Faecenecus gallistercoris]|nr:hypothetical protein [Bacillota bacterium]MDD7102142.1 hypothetical protein [Bacillota bacterium]MDY4051527.1 hypothetical protein [Candidatus Faecenecus gallistercoris]